VFVATAIASDKLSAADLSTLADALRQDGQAVDRPVWIDEGRAADIGFTGDATVARAAIEGLVAGIDVVVQPAANRVKKLLVADMDSTMITIECIDELADYAGIKAQIADVTERAMRGELVFEEALEARVALLKGLPETVIDTCYRERVRIMPGALSLVRTLRAKGGRAVLVSGGFTVFADRVAAEIGFDRAVSNTLNIADGLLAGTVAKPIVGAATKQQVLAEEQQQLGLIDALTLAIGDGANDIPMIQQAGLGVAYHAKPKTAAAAMACVNHGDLTAVLYAMGIPSRDWVA
jgi:phosphoserine phosphatase